MKVLGVIPARGGSKGVINKNIRPVCDRPLIAYTIDAANQSTELAECIVSTDSEEISSIAVANGGTVKFLRPSEFAGDLSSDLQVINHALNWYKENEGKTFDAVVYLRPTTPFKTGEMIDNAIKKLAQHNQYTAVRSVTKSEGIHHPYWMYKTSGDPATLESFVDNIDVEKDYYRRQLLPDCYRLNGVVDIMRTENIIAGSKLYGDNIGMLEITQAEELDIDTETDLKICEFLMREHRAGE